MKILIIEDNISIRNVLRLSFQAEGFTVDEAEDGEAGSYLGRINHYDIIILDNILPKKMAKQVCEEIRSSGINTPIILLSAKSDVNSKIELLKNGADDYMIKPFSYEELKARIEALLRRPTHIREKIIRLGKFLLNQDTHTFFVNNKKIYFTKKEFALVESMMNNHGKVLSRSFIMEHIWDGKVDPFSNTVETHIRNVRKKLNDKNKRIIQNIPGRGYKLLIN